VGTPHFNIYYKIPAYPELKKNRIYTFTIALSTTEDELDNFVRCVRSVLHTMRILENMGSPQHGVFEDNRSTIAICTNNMSPGNSRTKHVDELS
jgi:hypothetical protein